VTTAQNPQPANQKVEPPLLLLFYLRLVRSPNLIMKENGNGKGKMEIMRPEEKNGPIPPPGSPPSVPGLISRCARPQS
jgi:hypothetical protein